MQNEFLWRKTRAPSKTCVCTRVEQTPVIRARSIDLILKFDRSTQLIFTANEPKNAFWITIPYNFTDWLNGYVASRLVVAETRWFYHAAVSAVKF